MSQMLRCALSVAAPLLVVMTVPAAQASPQPSDQSAGEELVAEAASLATTSEVRADNTYAEAFELGAVQLRRRADSPQSATLLFVLRNRTSAEIERPRIGVLELDASDRVLAFHSLELRGSLAAYGEGSFEQTVRLAGSTAGAQQLRVTPVSSSFLDQYGLSAPPRGPRNCEDFCDFCASLAQAICSGGVKDFKCSCNDGNECSFTCAV